MNLNFLTLNKFFTIILLISHMHGLSMLNPYKEATKHNNNHVPLLCLPNEIIKSIFEQSFDTAQPLHTIIEPTLSLSIICKKITSLLSFPKIIRTIGQFYFIEQKNDAMKNLLEAMKLYYWDTNKRRTALFLTYVGAKNDAAKECSLLQQAIHRKDKQMITTLFKNNTSPNQKYNKTPAFFYIETSDIAQKFIDQKVNLNAEGEIDCTPNVLWACLQYNHPFDLITLYVNNNVDITKKNIDNSCLLHFLVRKLYSHSDIKKFPYIAILFLKKEPTLINIINFTQQTPLDAAYEILANSKNLMDQRAICQQLIGVFKKYGGKTAQQLKKT